MTRFLPRLLPYTVAFLSALLMSLALTPVMREICRKLGMVDRPDARRINKTPIPRGGGLAVVLTVTLVSVGCGCAHYRLMTLGLAIAALGFVDDRFSLKPVVKLAGQIAVAALVWAWAGYGFASVWTSIPPALDCLLTVFWIVGAVNAFNLIDGLDGLASGLALIATLGMAGVVVFLGRTHEMLYPLVFMGALLGFLRYNFNPASVFLGDCGSMFLGFVVAVLPFYIRTPNSLVVSIGVPLLAMGVPIFDTFLAILRRSIRHLLRLQGVKAGPSDAVMTADADHLHHRILRAVGLNQRKAAWILYSMALFLVLIGLFAINMESHQAGIWLVALTIGSIVVFRDMARVELYDTGRLLGLVAHRKDIASRRRMARLAIPFYFAFDVCAVMLAFALMLVLSGEQVKRVDVLVFLPVRLVCMMVALVVFRAYSTVWSRAVLSNYVRLMAACLLGSAAGTAFLSFVPSFPGFLSPALPVLFALMSFIAVAGVRSARGIIRDLFYALDCRRLIQRKDVSRVLVYGAGLGYKAFRQRLVRSTASNDRIVVGLVDDDILLRGHYIGGIRVLGTLSDVPELVVVHNIDTLVVTCAVTDEWLRIVREMLAPTGVRLTLFTFNEREIN